MTFTVYTPKNVFKHLLFCLFCPLLCSNIARILTNRISMGATCIRADINAFRFKFRQFYSLLDLNKQKISSFKKNLTLTLTGAPKRGAPGFFSGKSLSATKEDICARACFSRSLWRSLSTLEKTDNPRINHWPHTFNRQLIKQAHYFRPRNAL